MPEEHDDNFPDEDDIVIMTKAIKYQSRDKITEMVCDYTEQFVNVC